MMSMSGKAPKAESGSMGAGTREPGPPGSLACTRKMSYQRARDALPDLIPSMAGE